MAQDFGITEVCEVSECRRLSSADADMGPPSHDVEVSTLFDGGLRDLAWWVGARDK